MAAPVLAAYESRRLSLTRLGDGDVSLSELPVVVSDGGGITSWAWTPASGNTAEWTTYTDGRHPSPVANGVTAGSSVWNVTASNAGAETSAAVAVTITVPASPTGYTTSKRSMLVVINPGGDANASKINDRVLEFARGSTDFGLARYSSGNSGTTAEVIYFKDWRCTGSSTCIVRHEDPDNPCDLGRFQYRSPWGLRPDSLVVNTARRANPLSVSENAIIISNATGLSSDIEFLDTYNSPGIEGDRVVSGNNCNGVNFTAGSSRSMKVTFNNFEINGVCKAFGWGADVTSHYEILWSGLTIVRYYSLVGMYISQHDDTSTFRVEGIFACLSMLRDSGRPLIHADSLQIDYNTSCKNLYIEEIWVVQADGNGNSQAVFSNPSPQLGYALPNKIQIDRAFICHRASAGLLLTCTNTVDLPISVKNVTLIRQMSGKWGLDPASVGSPTNSLDEPPGLTPRLTLGSAIVPEAITLSHIWSHQSVVNKGSLTLPDSVRTNSNSADVSADMPGATWISSPELLQKLTDNDGVVNYLGADDERWALPTRELMDLLRVSCAPDENAPNMRLADGSYVGAFNPDGSSADGTPWAAASGTAFTMVAQASATIGAVIPITVALQQPEAVDVTITLTFSGVAGTASASSVVIPAGQISGSVSFTPSEAGTLEIDANDNRGLTDPIPVQVVIAPPTPPSSYTLSASPRRVANGRPVSILVALNTAATEAVTISVAVTGLAGTLSANEIVVGVGETGGSVSFTPAEPGIGTVSASDDRGLTDPATLEITSTIGGPTKGNLRRLLGVNV